MYLKIAERGALAKSPLPKFSFGSTTNWRASNVLLMFAHRQWRWCYHWKRFCSFTWEVQANFAVGWEKFRAFFHLFGWRREACCILSNTHVTFCTFGWSAKLGNRPFDLGDWTRFRLLFWCFIGMSQYAFGMELCLLNLACEVCSFGTVCTVHIVLFNIGTIIW